jgi:hypothetical protein
VGTIVLHFGQLVSVFGRFASCDRRFPVREFECLRLGTAMSAVLPKTNSNLGYPRDTTLPRTRQQ